MVGPLALNRGALSRSHHQAARDACGRRLETSRTVPVMSRETPFSVFFRGNQGRWAGWDDRSLRTARAERISSFLHIL
jgi:hypothetical protein